MWSGFLPSLSAGEGGCPWTNHHLEAIPVRDNCRKYRGEAKEAHYRGLQHNYIFIIPGLLEAYSAALHYTQFRRLLAK
jgi:hypothetical protein